MAPSFPPCTDYVILCALNEDGVVTPLRCTSSGELLTKVVPDEGV
jgi:hypothetical protein